MIENMFLLHQVLGNAKGAVAVVVSILIFRNPVSVTGMLGYALTVFGVILYSEAKKRSKWSTRYSQKGSQCLKFINFIEQTPSRGKWGCIWGGVATVLSGIQKFSSLEGSLHWFPLYKKRKARTLVGREGRKLNKLAILCCHFLS